MEHFLAWGRAHWFDLIQTLGIIGGLSATSLTLFWERKSRRLGDYLTLAGQHRELWSDAHRQPSLARIFHPEVDLVAQPISPQEQEFLNLVIVHFHTGWLLAREKVVLTLELLALDAKAFFQLPIPRGVWIATRHFRDPKFSAFIEKAAKIPHRTTRRTRKLSSPARGAKVLFGWFWSKNVYFLGSCRSQMLKEPLELASPPPTEP